LHSFPTRRSSDLNVHSRLSSALWVLEAGPLSDSPHRHSPIGEQRPVKIPSYRSLAVIAAAALWALPQAVVPEAMAAQAPNPHDAGRSATPAGSYLAARQVNLD